MSMMRIAVAGTGGLARLLAHYIDEQTSHHVMLLSRTAQPQLSERFQVVVTDYTDIESLKFALKGVDTVISTVTGPNQLHLIRAAIQARVRRFAPAEFEGSPSARSQGPLDRYRSQAQLLLRQYAGNIETTNFVCGIFYERFQPGGLKQSSVGLTSGFSGEGDYIMNIRNMSAQVPAYSSSGQADVTICMTSALDVARLVTRAIDLPSWPAELRMCGERVSVQSLTLAVESWTGEKFLPREMYSPSTLHAALRLAAAVGDSARGMRLHTLIATTAGQYDFTDPNLNSMFPDLQPIRFAQWFRAKWNLT